jgi:alkaline phosphatase
MKAILAAAALSLPAAAAASPAHPRSVIFVMADGLSWGPLQLARDEARAAGRALAMERVMDEGHAAYCAVTPLGALVPESGAAASAYATGRKIPNRSLSQLPDGTNVETILELARRRGLETGLVTTARLTHATPAAFLVHRPDREDEFGNARDIPASGVDVLLGGGRSRFPPGVLEKARAAGYAVVLDPRKLEGGLPPGKTLGLLAEESFPFSLDRRAAGPDVPPTLETMTRLALARLGGARQGFALVIDARLIDEAAHYHDAAAALSEIEDADRAVAAARDFVSAHPDAELVVASNHDAGGMSMSWRINRPSLGGPAPLKLLAEQRASFSAMLQSLWTRGGRSPSPALALEVLRAGLAPGVDLTEADARAVVAALRLGPKALPFTQSPAAQEIGRILEKQTLVVWNTGTHTSALQPCFGIGPGSESLHGLIEDSDVFSALRPAADYQ